MTVLQVLTDAWISYRGKSSNFPGAGTPKYNDMLVILNRKQREWWSDNSVDWPSLFQLLPSGTLVSGSQTYDVDDSVIRPSDYVMLTDSSGNNSYVTVVKPQIRTMYSRGCYFAGNPTQLTFITKIDSSYAGRTLTIPAYIEPNALVNPTDVIAVDDPNWCIYAVAAELARNDYSKEEQFPNLNSMANALYQQMVDNANANSFLQPNSIPNNMPQPNSFSGATPYSSNGTGSVF